MTKEELSKYIFDTYGVSGDNPWPKYPDNVVFRHTNNKKWFGLLMSVLESRLGEDGERMLDILNVKCDPLIIGSITKEKGIYPSYHMNKAHWISISIGDADEEQTKALLDVSYELTKPKIKRKKD
ncbi:MAG: MmcQ/YjbR family DNA-binding protein [Clostridia bacterium]|nr:MmcQ/YjbR family DNA-binding protein [Clostridia bacterium]